MSNSMNAVDKLVADATGHGIERFKETTNSVVFLTLDGEPVVIDDPAPLMEVLEAEMSGCLDSVGGVTWRDGKACFKEEVEDIGATDFLIKEAGRYLSLMNSIAAAFGDGWLAPETWPRLDELGATECYGVFEETLDYYREALRNYYAQQEGQTDG